MAGLRYDTPDHHVVTMTGGGVICVWSDPAHVNKIEGMVGWPQQADHDETPRTVRELADWYDRQRTANAASSDHRELLRQLGSLDAELAAAQAEVAAAHEKVAALQRRKDETIRWHLGIEARRTP
jgi:hypothetical protein